jgi:hypothetical protein
MTNYVEDSLAYGLLPGLGYLALLAGRILCRPVSSADCIICPDLISDSHKVGSRLRIAAQLIDAASGATHGQNALTARSTPRSDLAWQTGIKKVA